MTMKKGPSPALVTTSLIGSGTALILSGPPLIASGTILGGIGTALAAAGSLVTGAFGASSVPSATLASPFFTMFLDLFSGLSRGFSDASLGKDLFSEVLGGLGSAATTAAAPAVTAPCPFC